MDSIGGWLLWRTLPSEKGSTLEGKNLLSFLRRLLSENALFAD